MMILTVDVGNSRIKWALWQSGVIVARDAISHQQGKGVDIFDKLFAAMEKPSCIYVACVAGEKLSQALGEWCKRHWQLDAEFLKTEKQFKNIVNAYEDPQQHGVDRWAAVVAAHQSCPGFSVCVINAGTAITFDFVNKNGRHLGGYILPSYIIMRRALFTDTANVVSAFEESLYSDSVPDNTSDAVNQGLHKLLRAGIREICQVAKQKMDSPIQIVISGGSAETVLAYSDMPAMKHEPDLVMQGLYGIMSRYGVGG